MGDPDAQYEWRMIGSNQINKLFSIWRRLWTSYETSSSGSGSVAFVYAMLL
ncbi:hypothetical protein LINGRAHAP2_LOCUS2295, partial [Linum grandiflorum]